MQTTQDHVKSLREFSVNPGDPSLHFGKMGDKAWTIESVINALRRQPFFGGTVVALLLTGVLSMAVGTALGLVNFRDVGYPDSASLFRIAEFIRSGHIYSDINRPPYHLTLYGPLTYVLLAIPYWLAQKFAISAQVLVRLSIVGVLCFCVLLIFMVSKRLYSSRPIAWLCALFAVSSLPMAFWTTQIRGDLLGVAFSFLSIYVFLAMSGRRQLIGAAFCAGVAPLVKQTFLAAPIAIIIWLAYRRRFKEAAFWAMAFAFTVVGGYAIVWWHEPLLLKHLSVLRHPILEYRFAREIIWHAVAQPVVPFAVTGGFLALWKRVPERVLLVIYCVAAWFVAILTVPNIGGGINYFWEPLLVSAVLAGPGLCELQRRVSRTPILVNAMILFLLFRSSLPMLRQELDYLKLCYTDASSYQVRKTKWEAFMSTVSGRRLLSTIPEVTLQSSIPEIPDPYLNSSLELRGQWSSGPLVSQIDASVFDLIVIKKGQAEASPLWIYRGIGSWSDSMWGALKRTYRPACVFDDMEVWLPAQGSSEIVPSLLAIGCVAVVKQFNSGSGIGSQVQP